MPQLAAHENLTQADAFRAASDRIAKETILHFTSPTGEKYVYHQPKFSIGTGNNIDAAERDAKLAKQSRLESGERSGRDQPPPGFRQVFAAGDKISGNEQQPNGRVQAPVSAPVAAATSAPTPASTLAPTAPAKQFKYHLNDDKTVRTFKTEKQANAYLKSNKNKTGENAVKGYKVAKSNNETWVLQKETEPVSADQASTPESVAEATSTPEHALENVEGQNNLDADSLATAMDIADQIGDTDLNNQSVSDDDFMRALGATEEEINGAKTEAEGARATEESSNSETDASIADRTANSAEQSGNAEQVTSDTAPTPTQVAADTESANATKTPAVVDEAPTNPIVAELRALNQNITGMREDFALANQTPEQSPASKSKTADQTAAEKAKADFDDALNDLGDIFGSNFRKSMMPEQEQKLVPVLTRLMDAAFRRGYFKFKDAAKFVLDAIRGKFGDDAAGSITLDHLQGAYIGMAGRYQEQGADTKNAVISVESIDEVSLDKAAETVINEESGDDNDPTAQRPSTENNIALDAVQPEGGIPKAENVRGARQPRQRPRRSNDGSVQRQGGLFHAGNDASENVGDGGRPENISNGSIGNVAGSPRRVSADFRPGNGDLTRQGSWFDAAKRNIDLIELARTIYAEKRNATPEEQAQLAKYVGFGAGAIRNNLFPIPPEWAKRNEPTRKIWPEFTPDARWKGLAERIAALPKEWQDSVLQSTQYAHYTS